VRSGIVKDLGNDLLAAAVDVLTDPPERQFFGHGSFAHDCELVAVSVLSIEVDQPDLAAGSQACALVPIVNLQLTVLRCYPTVADDAPTAAALTAASSTLADDAVAISGDLLDRWSADTLFPTAGVHCDRVDFGDLRPVGPEGGIAGWRVSFAIRF
jgi:hypothetical protein